MNVAAGAIKKLDAHVWEREANEHYVEPEWCSGRLFQEEGFAGDVWDPCCGFGRIPKAALAAGIPHVFATDIVDRGYVACEAGVDFLTYLGESLAPNIVCNPPFNIAEEFGRHAWSLMGVQKVAMIFPTARLNAAHWLHALPLSCVWLMTPRPSMPPGHVIAAGEKPGGGKMDYCWLVFEKFQRGMPKLRWLRRDRA
jgi:hypothetical protein